MLAASVNADITFEATKNGKITLDEVQPGFVNGKATVNKNAQEKYQLKAIPDSGYKFAGWYNSATQKYVNLTAEWEPHFEEDITLAAIFVSDDSASFEVGLHSGDVFFDLNAAIQYATEKQINQIVLVGDGTLPAGDYAIPSGKTLLIPYNEAHTVCTTEPVYHAKDSSATSSKAYKTLTMASGANITVQSGGAISVSARAQNTTPNAGVVLGPWGLIKMETSSGITLESGANLYCWGFITGQGSVLAKSGSKVYENFQVPAFRGGNASSGMNGGNKQKVFPFTQFYIQNVEVPLTFEAGATDEVQIGVSMSVVGLQKGGGTLIGTNSGLFRISEGTVTKRYDGETDRLIVEIDGKTQISSMTVEIGSAGKIYSEKFVVPVTNNMTVRVNSGCALAIREDLALLPGAQLIVDEGAQLTLDNGKNLYVYDRDEWIGKSFAANNTQNFVPLTNVPGRSQKRTDNDLLDAKIDVNGTMTVNGGLYTTAGGADITTSTGKGTIIFQSAAGNESKTYQVTQSGNTVTTAEVPITSAQLKNAAPDANPYSVTAGAAAGDTFYYHNGMWDKKNAPAGEHYPHVSETIEALPPTCTTPGKAEGSKCVVCGKVLGGLEELPASHTYQVQWGEWTQATDSGEWSVTATLVCSVCDDTAEGHSKEIPAEEIAMTGTVDKEATCAEAGSKSRHCTNAGCTATTDVTEIPTTGEHTWNKGAATKEPSCTEKGETTYTCSTCGGTKTEETAALDHDFAGDFTVDQEVTCTEKGIKSKHCSRCDAKADVTEIEALSHDLQDVPDTGKTATCTEAGVVGGTYCTRCGDGKAEAEKVIEQLNHDLDQGTVTTPATYMKAGIKTHRYSRCVKTVTEVIPTTEGSHTNVVTTPEEPTTCQKSGHTEVTDAVVPPTCGETGLSEGSHCSVCNTVLTEQEVISKLDHTPAEAVWENETAATCTKAGLTEGKH